MMTLNELCTMAYRNAVEKGFEDGKRTVGDEIALMHSELSEALEEYREGNLGWTYYTVDGNGQNKPEGIGIELADVVIRIANFCGKHKIDLQECIEEKFAYNLTRPHKHGGKLI